MGGKTHISSNGVHVNTMANAVARIKNGLFGTLFVLQKDAPASSRVVSVLLGTIIKMFQVRRRGGVRGRVLAAVAGRAGRPCARRVSPCDTAERPVTTQRRWPTPGQPPPPRARADAAPTPK